MTSTRALSRHTCATCGPSLFAGIHCIHCGREYPGVTMTPADDRQHHASRRYVARRIAAAKRKHGHE